MPSALPAGVIPCSACSIDHDYTPGTNRGQKCQPCYSAMMARCAKARREARRATPQCPDCKRVMPPRIGKGRWRERCADCHRTHLRQLDAKRYYLRRRVFIETGVCIKCDSPFVRTGKGGPVPQWCEPCKAARQRDLDRVHCHSRRARKLSLPHETIRPSDVYRRDDWTCQLCSLPIDPDLTWPDQESRSIDHIRPLSRGGHHVMTNVQAAHLGCNLRKSCSYEIGEDVA